MTDTDRPTVLAAPDSFKGTFSAVEIAAAMATGVSAAGMAAVPCPIADGGEGTLDAVLAARPGEVRTVSVSGALGDHVEARVALFDGGATALVEAAEAVGLALLAEGEREPMRASTEGVGELLAAAARTGAGRVLLGVGGTSTTDGGSGAVEALRAGRGLGGARLSVLCDVRTAFEDAARLFAPQKGADAEEVELLGRRLDALARRYPRDPRGVPLTGAGGGLAGGLWAALGAELVPGAHGILELVGFAERLAGADLVLTGEGRLDTQTAEGKAVAEVCAWAHRAGVPVAAIVGRCDLERGALARVGLRAVREAGTLEAVELAAGELGQELSDSRPAP